MKKIKLLSIITAAAAVFNLTAVFARAENTAFELISTQQSENLGGTVYRYRHKLTGAEVVYNDNDSDKCEFVLGFKTPPVDSKGANHVLEHALFCGSEKYPVKNIMHYIQNGTSSLMLNGFTADDCTYYMIVTENNREYYNMIDVYMNGIFHPLLLRDENIFRQQGIRVEYDGGEAKYNGVVYNELRIKNLNTEENSVNFLSDKLYRAIYGNTAPSFSAGGEMDAIKELTYDDLLRVYNTFYIPSNSMTYLSGKQDIDKTLDILDGFFSENTTEAPELSFEDTRRIPEQKIQEYNIDENTKTVDIGFMFSGVSADADPKDKYANEIVYDIIRQKMEDKGYSNMYTVGGNTGGVSALGLMISQVPLEEKEKVIADHNAVLEELAKNGIDEKEIDKFVDNDDRYFFQNFDRVMIGLLYKNNPLAYTEINAMREYYKNHHEYFEELLKKYFTENPYFVTVVSGNGVFGTEDSSVKADEEELKKIKRDTEEFQKWNDEEDDPEVIARIPFLELDEVRTPPEKEKPEYEERDRIKFYYTNKEEISATLYFPLDIKSDELDYAYLMQAFAEYQAEKKDMSFYSGIMPFGSENNPDKLNPHFIIGFFGENIEDEVKKAIEFFGSPELWNADDLEEYIKTTPKKIFDSYYDPYFLSAELKDSSIGAEGRFSSVIPLNTIVKGSSRYYHFLRGLNGSDAKTLLPRLESMAYNIIMNGLPVAGYEGDRDGYESFKDTVRELFKDGREHKIVVLDLPVGYHSAVTVTKLADANHFMIAGVYGDTEYSGKMAVLGNVLTTKYAYPVMRGKHGAYGCNVRFGADGMTSAVTGLADIDMAIGLWRGMGDFLRNMTMTQNELNSFIVSAVQEYDSWEYVSSENGANFALKDKSPDVCEKIRNEMLATTVEDIKGYADFVDELVAQKRVFAVLGKDAADKAEFDFAYYADADNLTVTPRFKKNPTAYIKGKTEAEFKPDAKLTRAETAAMIQRLMADGSPSVCESEFEDVNKGDWFYEAVESVTEKGIMCGCGDNMFMPQKYITRAELAAVLSEFIFRGNDETDIEYSDISEDDWYYKPMVKLINAGIMTGYADGTLRPGSSVTRAEAAAMINRAANVKIKSGGENPFDDVLPSHWAYYDIISAAA